MSMLRKRSSWVVPTVSLLLGALALGVAGCGGDDDDDDGGVGTGPIQIPAGALPAPVTATRPTQVTANVGATVNGGTIADPNATGGITSATVVIPANALQNNANIGLEVIPSAQSTIEAIRRIAPNSVAGISPVAEIVFGPVGTNGQIDTSTPIVFNGNAALTLGLTAAQAQALQQSLANGTTQLRARRVTGTGTDQQLTVIEDCNEDLQGTGANATLILSGNCSGRIVITQDATSHPQGGAS